MDGNKEDAQRCLQLASNALSSGDIERATRLLAKSRRMYPLTKDQDTLHDKIERVKANTNSTSNKKDNSQTNGNASTASSSTASNGSPREPTSKMTEAVSKIQSLKNKSHYDVLGVSRDASEAQIKKAYKKLALQLHPDRNHAKGADEAFKRVGQAFMTLSDPTKRTYYDQTGHDNEQESTIRYRRRGRRTDGMRFSQNGTHFQFHSDVTPEELFEFMFANSGGSENLFREARAPHRAHHYDESESLLGRIRPVIILFMLIFVLSLLYQDSSSPDVSLNPTHYYQRHLQTRNGINYYVSSGLKIKSGTVQRQLEYQADRMAYIELRDECAREEENRERIRRRAESWFAPPGTRRKYKKLYKQFQRPYCEKMIWLRNRIA